MSVQQPIGGYPRTVRLRDEDVARAEHHARRQHRKCANLYSLLILDGLDRLDAEEAAEGSKKSNT